MIRVLLVALLLLSTSACKRDRAVPVPKFLGGDEEVAAATATELDSLAAQGAFVSVSGTVLEQDGRDVLLDDGTGLIRVHLPEQPPLMTGHRLLASGRLSDEDGAPRLRAAEWLYDSTAVPVHSD
jgi:hypothetical protein